MNHYHVDKTRQYQQNGAVTPPSKSGFEYFIMGWSLAFKPGIKRFVFFSDVS